MLNSLYSFKIVGNDFDVLFEDPTQKDHLKHDVMSLLHELIVEKVKNTLDHKGDRSNSAALQHMRTLLSKMKLQRLTSS